MIIAPLSVFMMYFIAEVSLALVGPYLDLNTYMKIGYSISSFFILLMGILSFASVLFYYAFGKVKESD